MTPTQAKDHLLSKLKAGMKGIGLEYPKDYELLNDGDKWVFVYLKNHSDKQYLQAHYLLELFLNG
jgi:hypothetical protein